MIEEISTQVCIAGGGPAGMMLGLLLGRAGIDVVVLEKHADFFRDFRGDTVHPSTMNLIDQLGIRDAFERIPHARLPRLDAVVDGIRLHAIDFRSLPKPNREVTLMPQWDLLDLLAEEARRSPSFRLVMDADVTGVTWTGQRVTGVMAQTPDGELRVRADLTVAADGRDSTVRQALDLGVDQFGVPIDLTWFRLDRPVDPVPDTLGYLRDGSVLITIPRPEYLQCGLLIPKDGFSDVQAAGLGAFRDRIRRVAPRLGSVVDGLQSWDQVTLLSVQIDRVQRWSRGGALCIGDAAHAMSPVFGVGINYAGPGCGSRREHPRARLARVGCWTRSHRPRPRAGRTTTPDADDAHATFTDGGARRDWTRRGSDDSAQPAHTARTRRHPSRPTHRATRHRPSGRLRLPSGAHRRRRAGLNRDATPGCAPAAPRPGRSRPRPPAGP